MKQSKPRVRSVAMSDSEQNAPTLEPWVGDTIAVIVFIGIVLTGTLVTQTGLDPFRTPKTLMLRGASILLAATWLIAAVLGAVRRSVTIALRKWRFVGGLTGAIVVWTVVTTLTSTNRRLSVGALGEAVATAIFFLCTLYVATSSEKRKRSMSPLIAVMIAAVANAVVSLLQTFGIMQPIHFIDQESFISRSALIGNPNEVGCYLMGPALAAIAMAVVERDRIARWAWSATAFTLGTALAINQTRTTILAFIAGLGALLLIHASRRTIAGLALAIFVIGAVFVIAPGQLSRLPRITSYTVEGVDYLLSGRVIPFAAAMEIVLDHPIVGSGPGTFGWQYMPYRIKAETRYPSLRRVYTPINFGEVHNDQLEILCETGFPGWLLALAAILAVGWPSLGALRRSRSIQWDHDVDTRRRFSELASLPLATAFFIMTLAQFSLQITSTTIVYVVLAAVLLAWGRK